MSSSALMIFIIIQILFAAVLLFFGYRLVRVMISLGAFILFGSLAYAFFSRQAGMEQMWVIIAALAVGLIAAAVGHFVYRFGFFCLGAFAGYTFASMLTAGMSMTSTAHIAILVGSAILCGILGIVLARPAIIVYMSYVGSHNLTLFGLYLAMNFNELLAGTSATAETIYINLEALYSANTILVLCMMGALFLAGMITQFKRTGHHK